MKGVHLESHHSVGPFSKGLPKILHFPGHLRKPWQRPSAPGLVAMPGDLLVFPCWLIFVKVPISLYFKVLWASEPSWVVWFELVRFDAVLVAGKWMMGNHPPSFKQ